MVRRVLPAALGNTDVDERYLNHPYWDLASPYDAAWMGEELEELDEGNGCSLRFVDSQDRLLLSDEYIM